MAWKKNNKAKEMYQLYLSGVSLEQVGIAYGVTRQSVWGLFQYRGWGMRSRKQPLPYILFNGEKYTRRNTGYFGKTRGNRNLLHRDVWEHHNGSIPDGWDIHHKDEDRENNKIGNLECLPKAEHTKLYSPHNNQYTKGRKRSS